MPDTLFSALALALVAGVTIPLGAALAMVEAVLPRWRENERRHAIIAFGAGALLAAVALVLVPEGSAPLSPLQAISGFGAGGLAFFMIDKALAQRGGRASQFMAMMLDYVPEAMALGALLAGQSQTALLLAGLIALQNLPEGFNAFREMQDTPERARRGAPRWRVFAVFVLVVPLGPLAAAAGVLWLDGLPQILGAIMLFSAGGIVYLMFQDLAPQVALEKHWSPPLGAVAGFSLGLAGHLYLH